MSSNDSIHRRRLFCSLLRGTSEISRQLLVEFNRTDLTDFISSDWLQEAVATGKALAVEWVEALLEKGADPGSVQGLAAAGYQGDGDRALILKLVRLVSEGWEAGQRCYQETQGGTVECSRGLEMDPDRDRLLQELSDKVSRLSQDVNDRLDKMSKEISSKISSALRKDLGDSERNLSTTLDRSSADLMKALTSRDELLVALETGVTSMVGEWHPFRETLDGIKSRVEAGARGGSKLTDPVVTLRRGISPDPDEMSRRDCIGGMMQKTILLNGRTNDQSRFRELYHILLSVNDVTASILLYLRHMPEVRIMVDCESVNVGGMRSRVLNHDGHDYSGSTYLTFADFRERCVYVGGFTDTHEAEERLVGRLAMSLGRLTNYLFFDNDGKPYAAVDDDTSGLRYRSILSEARDKKRRGDSLGGHFDWGLSWQTELGREIALVSAVPRMMAEHGSVWGTRKLRRHLPSLLEFYEGQVLEPLRKETEALHFCG